jgi:CDGSH-type Zn-finger protein
MDERPECPQKSPYVQEIAPGTYAWCACGRSARQPFCDGSHGGSSFLPVIERVTEARRVAWCGCKGTATPPFCDGSHSRA